MGAEDPIPLCVTRKTVVVAPLVRDGDQPVRGADVHPSIRQQPQKLGIRSVCVGDGCREQASGGSCNGDKKRTERIYCDG
ncbi:MAG: hypothetical protein WB777_02575 [Mycobacterium sp.]